MTEKFNQYSQAHSRLYDPEVLQSSAELVPVSLDQIASASRPKSVGKGVKRRRPNSAPAVMQRLLNPGEWSVEELKASLKTANPPSLTSYLPWLTATTATPSKSLRNSSGAKSSAENKKAAPNIRITPLIPKAELDIFQEQPFELQAVGARHVEMIWRGGNEVTTRRAIMDHSSGDRFKTSVGIDDGDYLFAYNVDGWIRPEPEHATRIVLRSDGVWSRVRLARHEHLLAIQNLGVHEESLRLESTVSWMTCESQLRIPALTTSLVNLRILPRELSAGLNEGSVQVVVLRDGEETPLSSADVELVAKAGGTIADFKFRPSELGSVLQGQDQLSIEVEVYAHGTGPLTGMVMLRHSGELADFRLDPSRGETRFHHTFHIDSSNLPHLADGKVKMTFVTDSYLANYRLFELELPYHLVYLKKSLPALSYGSVRKGATRTLRVDVERSDGKSLDLEARIPSQSRSYLEAYAAGPSAFSFRFDSRTLPLGQVVNDVVTLVDRPSGLADQLRVLAEVCN